ncbi:hypothetical protein CGCF413_v003117 [Colletotrichum fructicola]|nr:hypothetical protein CGCF413_v003117 [Colletotrichum fructicola]
MTTIERRAVALALATGVLQLFDTPWLRDRWSINDIYVDKREQACLFVMMELDAPLKQDPTERKNHQSLLVHPNPRLFALAVALLELTYGAPLSSFREKGDGDDDFTELRIADRLTQRIKDREYGAFTSVVYRCMRPVSDDYDKNTKTASRGRVGFAAVICSFLV